MRLLSLAIGLTLLTAFVAAETRQSPDRPTFEVASIKPNKSGESRNGADAAQHPAVRTARRSGLHGPEPGTTDAGAPADGASLFTALQEQLGLRLEARRAPVNVFVLETAERPEE